MGLGTNLVLLAAMALAVFFAPVFPSHYVPNSHSNTLTGVEIGCPQFQFGFSETPDIPNSYASLFSYVNACGIFVDISGNSSTPIPLIIGCWGGPSWVVS